MIDYVTNDDLRAAVAPLATREEMHAAIAPLATRDEMHAAIGAAVTPLATREEMHAAIGAAITPLATRQDVRESEERTRRHMEALIESLRDDIRLLAEGQVSLHHRIENVRSELKADIAALDRRVMRLEARG